MEKFIKFFNLKVLATLFVMAAVSVALSACGDDDDDDDLGSGSLAGVWTCESAYGQKVPAGFSIIFTLNSDGMGSKKEAGPGHSSVQTFKWHADNNALYLTDAKGDDVDKSDTMLYYRLNGSKKLYIYDDLEEYDMDKSGNSDMKMVFKR